MPRTSPDGRARRTVPRRPRCTSYWTTCADRGAWCSGGSAVRPVTRFPITLRTSLDTPLTHLARQISSRPATQRFDPVVCTGTDGTYLGVVDVEQLLRVLADQVDNLGRVHVPTT